MDTGYPALTPDLSPLKESQAKVEKPETLIEEISDPPNPPPVAHIPSHPSNN